MINAEVVKSTDDGRIPAGCIRQQSRPFACATGAEAAARRCSRHSARANSAVRNLFCPVMKVRRFHGTNWSNSSTLKEAKP